MREMSSSVACFFFPFGVIGLILLHQHGQKQRRLFTHGEFTVARVVACNRANRQITVEFESPDGTKRQSYTPFLAAESQVAVAEASLASGAETGILYDPQSAGRILLAEALVQD